MTEDNFYVTNQTSPIYNTKQNIWKQISNSYAGGETYRDAGYLHKFTQREPSGSYDERLKRSIYFNNVQPLADLITGFLYTANVLRSDYKQEEIIEKASYRQSLDNFMQTVAVNSLMYTCGVLVDSPQFGDEVQTEADRLAANLNPYCVLYHPWQIRNYYCDDYGVLRWVLLDNSYYDNSDPFKEATCVTRYRLWTSEYFQDFESISSTTHINNATTGSTETIQALTSGENFKAGEQVPHNLGEVPFIFVNWSNRTGEKYEDTIFEDIALFDQSIYNYMSLMDEMLAGGTFKFLFYPGKVPEDMESQSFSNLAIISWDTQSANKPFFDGPNLTDITPFLSAIEFLLVGILRKLGLNTDAEKNYVQSGSAKFFDFKKTRALLSGGAESMEETEREIFRLSGLWLGIDDSDVKIEYQRDFMGEEAQVEFEKLMQVIALQHGKMSEYAMKRVAELTFDKLGEKEMKEINDDIEKEGEDAAETREAGRLNLQAMAEQQKQDNNNEGTEENGRE